MKNWKWQIFAKRKHFQLHQIEALISPLAVVERCFDRKKHNLVVALLDTIPYENKIVQDFRQAV